MKYLVIILVAVVVILLSTFGIQNPYPVTIRFIQWQLTAVPLYAVMLASVLIGILFAVLLGLPGRIQRQIEVRRLRRTVEDQDKQIADLKSRLPAPVMQPLPEEPTVGQRR